MARPPDRPSDIPAPPPDRPSDIPAPALALDLTAPVDLLTGETAAADSAVNAATGSRLSQPHRPLQGELPAGTLVGEYQVTGLLGQGGMGAVYAGVHPLIGKRVAIKVLKPELAVNQEVVARFIQEARAVNQARSPYIVDIFSFGQLPDGRHYYVMEFIDGGSLRQLTDKGDQLTASEVLQLLSCVLKALSAAHDSGIVHRDMKPENIVLWQEPDGGLSAKVLDFGIAKLTGDGGELKGFATATGATMGTPYYMSPEQLRGIDVDHRTDIYAIGVIMYELFVGSLPFSGPSYIDLAHKHIYEPPPPPAERGVELPGLLEALILRCLEKDPANRPQTIHELRAELAEATDELGEVSFPSVDVVARPGPSSSTQAARPMQERHVSTERAPRRRLPLLALVGLLLLLGGGVGLLLITSAGQEEAPPAAPPRPPINTAPSPAPAFSSLQLRTDVSDAQYYLDDALVGSGEQLTLEQLQPGEHLLLVKATGYHPLAQKIRLAPDHQLKLRLALQPEKLDDVPQQLRDVPPPSKKGQKPRRPKPPKRRQRQDRDDTLDPFAH